MVAASPFWRPCRGPSHYEVRVETHGATFVAAAESFTQQVESLPAGSFTRLVDRGQIELGHGCESGVVVPDYGHLVRNTDPGSGQEAHRSDGRDVVVGQERRRPILESQDARGGIAI